jgi:hypothetical protein
MPRGKFLNTLIQQVNRNTVALGPPRKHGERSYQEADGAVVYDDDSESADSVDAQSSADPWASLQIWTEVSKAYEDVDVDGATVRRRTTSTFDTPFFGTVQLVFDNTDL